MTKEKAEWFIILINTSKRAHQTFLPREKSEKFVAYVKVRVRLDRIK